MPRITTNTRNTSGIPSASCVLLTLGLAASAVRGADQVCVDDLPPLPVEISNNAVTSVDHGDGTFSLYSFMGITNPFSSASITDAAFRLDWPGGGWQAIAPAPRLNGQAKIGANAISVAGGVYLIGGYTALGGEVTEPRLFRYDADDDIYVQLADVPVEVDDTVVGVYQERYIVLVSGWHGPLNRNVPNVQFYDTTADEWTQATPIPGPLPGLFGHAGTIVGDRIIYMDGTKSTSFTIFDGVYAGRIDPAGTGDFATIDWAFVGAHPGAPTYRAASSQGPTVDGRMLLVGGTDNPYNISGIGYDGMPAIPLAQVLAFDARSEAWEALAVVGDRPPTMDHRGLVAVPGGWATVGGMTAPGITTDRVMRFTIMAAGPAGDTNCDGIVDVADLLAVLGDWGPCAGCAGDVNDDGAVDVADLLAVLASWG